MINYISNFILPLTICIDNGSIVLLFNFYLFNLNTFLSTFINYFAVNHYNIYNFIKNILIWIYNFLDIFTDIMRDYNYYNIITKSYYYIYILSKIYSQNIQIYLYNIYYIYYIILLLHIRFTINFIWTYKWTKRE